MCVCEWVLWIAGKRILGWAEHGWIKFKFCSLVLLLRIHLLCKCLQNPSAVQMFEKSQRHPKAVQVRGEKFWLWIKTKSCQGWWHPGQSQGHCGTQEGAVRAVVHRSIPVWFPTVSLGLKPLCCRAGLLSLHQLLGVPPHHVLLSFLYLLKLEKQKGEAASELLVSQW